VLRLRALPRRALLLVAVVTLVATASCSGAKPPAATVAGVDITRAELFSDLKAEADGAEKAKPDAQGNALSSPSGSTPDSYTSAAAATALTGRVLYRVYEHGLAELGARVTTADSDSARKALCVDQSTGQETTDGSCPALDDYPAAYKAFQISLRARGLAFSSAVARKGYAKVKATQPASLRQVCFDVAGVATEAVTKQIQLAVAGGATLDAAVKAVGTDSSGQAQVSDVQAGCLYRSEAPASLAGAKVGEVVPVQTSDGSLYVALVTSFATANATTFAAGPPANDPKVSAVLTPIAKKILGMRISIDPRYGHWDRATLTVVPPEGPVSSTTTTTPAGGALTPANP